jgi:hypothetical protein
MHGELVTYYERMKNLSVDDALQDFQNLADLEEFDPVPEDEVEAFFSVSDEEVEQMLSEQGISKEVN